MSKKKLVRSDNARCLKPDMHASTSENLGEALSAFVMSITSDATKEDREKLPQDVLDNGHSGWYPLSGDMRVLDFNLLSEFELSKALQSFYTSLKRSFKDAEESAYNKGLAQGKDLLMGLNKGDISISDFDGAVSKYTLSKKKN